MSRDDDATPAPPRRASSIKISQWGIVQAWLGSGEGRLVTLCHDEGGRLVVKTTDLVLNVSVTEAVEADEDISRTALRASSKMPQK